MINTAKFVTKPSGYAFAKSGAVTDTVLMSVAAQYEQSVIRKMTMLPEAKASTQFSGTALVMVSEKYDGEGVFIYFEKNKELFCFNAPSGRARYGFNALTALGSRLEKSVDKALLRAELYLPPVNGKRRSSSDVTRTSFSGDTESVGEFRLAVIDIIMLNGANYAAKPFTVVWKELQEMLPFDSNAVVHAVEGFIESENTVLPRYRRIIDKGGEGVVVRRLDTTEFFKIKPRKSIETVIIGYVEDDYEFGRGVASLLTAVSYSDTSPETTTHTFQITARVGSGFTDLQRAELLEFLEKIQMRAPISLTDSAGRVIKFVQPSLIAEITYEDLLPESDRETPNKSQLITFSQDSGYQYIGLSAFPRLSFATFLKIREDKSVSDADINQLISGRKKPEPLQSDALIEPKIIRREVYRKGEMVRKLVVLNTSSSKRNLTLIYWIDYSAKRKDPFKSEIYVAFTPERIDEICNRLISENVVKGWVKA
jgi:hypothetical protein